MNPHFKTLAAAAAALSAQAAIATPTPVFKDSFLAGVEGLVVGDKTYDVAWTLGTCADVFGASVCAGPSTSFEFTTSDQARAATLALDAFMATMDKTRLPGYQPSTGNTLTFIATPFGVAANIFDPPGPVPPRQDGYNVLTWRTSGLGFVGRTQQINVRTTRLETYAVYTLSAPTAPVPEPASWLLMGLGLGTVGFLARQRAGQAAAATAPRA